MEEEKHQKDLYGNMYKKIKIFVKILDIISN
jgi:hypothetical protein